MGNKEFKEGFVCGLKKGISPEEILDAYSSIDSTEIINSLIELVDEGRIHWNLSNDKKKETIIRDLFGNEVGRIDSEHSVPMMSLLPNFLFFDTTSEEETEDPNPKTYRFRTLVKLTGMMRDQETLEESKE
jgi:hypothetical protein